MAFRGNDQEDFDYGQQMQPAAQKNIKLTLAFAKAVAKHQSDKSDNLVVSPHNAAAALSMVALGTDGPTRDELNKALYGDDGKSLEDNAKDYSKLNSDVLKANKGQVDVTTANGIWANQAVVELRDTFVADVKKIFGAEVSAEDYGDPATVQKINQWASDNTNKLIPSVLDSLQPDDAVVLASALHFKGEWTNKFDKKLTEDKGFTQDGAVAATTPTMHQDFDDEGGFRYLKGKDYEAISMSYGKQDYEEGKYPTMRIVLVRPSDDSVSARDFLDRQDSSKVPAWLAKYSYGDAFGSVELPRLDIKQKHDLIPALKDLGVKKAFGGGSFNAMASKGSEKLYVSKVSHDTVFKTDEEGSEGAAVTTVVVTTESVHMPPPRVDMKLDRSFIFAVQDIQSGAVLFLGTVNKPNEDTKPAARTVKKPVVKAKKPGKHH
jgi:serpin B